MTAVERTHSFRLGRVSMAARMAVGDLEHGRPDLALTTLKRALALEDEDDKPKGDHECQCQKHDCTNGVVCDTAGFGGFCDRPGAHVCAACEAHQ